MIFLCYSYIVLGELVTRPDDNPETIRNRLRVYHESTFPLVGFYQKRGLISKLDGKAKIEDLQSELESLCRKF